MSKAKIVVITGVSRGLGRAMVDEFVRQGWTVAGCCRSQKAVGELKAQHAAPHYFASVDVADSASVQSFCESALAQVGTPDLLLNNAAVINTNAPLWEVPEQEFNQVVDVNIKGTYYMIKHIAPAMLAQGHGVIVNFSSGWGRSTDAEVAPYCASKFAIEGLSKSMSQETGGKVSVVALNPGIINTDMLQSCFAEGANDYDDAVAWAKRSVPFLIQIDQNDNGRSLTAP